MKKLVDNEKKLRFVEPWRPAKVGLAGKRVLPAEILWKLRHTHLVYRSFAHQIVEYPVDTFEGNLVKFARPVA